MLAIDRSQACGVYFNHQWAAVRIDGVKKKSGKSTKKICDPSDAATNSQKPHCPPDT